MCGSTSIWTKIAFVVIVIGLILHIVGFATASWMVYQTETTSARVGLWRMKTCVGESCSETSVSSSLQTDEFRTTQVFEILTLMLFIAAVGAVGAYLFVSAIQTPCMALSAMILCFAACCFGFIGMICWLSYIPDPYVVSYSMGLTIIAAILALIAGLLLIPDVIGNGIRGKRGPYPVKSSRVTSPPNSRFHYR